MIMFSVVLFLLAKRHEFFVHSDCVMCVLLLLFACCIYCDPRSRNTYSISSGETPVLNDDSGGP